VRNVVQYGPRAQAVEVYLRTYQLLPQARASELCEDLFGQRLTPATLGTALTNCAMALTAVEATLKQEVAQFDETGLRVARAARVVARGLHADDHALWCPRQTRARGDG
jgi:hypothetical protein